MLYKPLLRIFRNVVKEFFGDIGEGAMTFEQVKDNVLLIMEQIELPKELMTEKSLHSLLYLICSKVHHDSTRGSFCEGVFKDLAKYQDEISVTFSTIFK